MAAMVALPSVASADAGRSGLSDYARARIADAAGELQLAARGYSAALSEIAFDERLATRAYRRSMAAGDRSLALQAANSLRQAGATPVDAQFLFLAEALEDGDWVEAGRVVDRIEEQDVFASLVPVLRAWIAFGADNGDPIAILDNATAENANIVGYASEHRALLLVAMGRYDEGVPAIQSLTSVAPARMLRLRLSTAAQLANDRRRDEALALLQGEGRALEAARARLNRRRSIPGAIDGASDGVAEAIVRLAAELNRGQTSALAVTLARAGTFMSPDNSVAWLVTSGVLSRIDQPSAALNALEQISDRDPFFPDAQDARVRLLVDADNAVEALEIAQDRVVRRNATGADWQRVGEMHAALENYDESAEAYRRALSLVSEDDSTLWAGWLLYGGALLDAERWDEALPALDRSVELGPDQPLALNFLGYALLERREQLDRAETLIARASELSPNNASITDSLGWVQFVRGNLDEAIPTLERAAVGDPDEPTINEHLGDAYWTAGRRREARFAWQAAVVTAEDEALERLQRKLDIGLTPETASP